MWAIYAKGVTFIFALFCAANSQSLKAAAVVAPNDTFTVSGVAKLASDSSLMKTIIAG
jgi:hypothetical protein